LIDIQQIFRTLPHRYPMLLVDRIVEVDFEARTCRAIKNVTINEPFFPGHYPGLPVMPGVLILECMAQVGAVLVLKDPKYQGRVPLIGAIDDVKFRRMVVPGDQLVVEVQVLWMKGMVGRMKGIASVEGEMAATMEMTFKLSAKEE
jgi:beta-hydroxyacyl-ACP dehydratase FabZ